MSRLQNHFRKTMLAGVFAAIPIAVTGFILWYIEGHTRSIVRNLFNINIPFAGVVLAIGLIYLLGLAVTSLVGQFFLGIVDAMLSRLPVLRELYRAWKQVSLTPAGTTGIF